MWLFYIMTRMFDKLFFKFSDFYKSKYKAKANTIASLYITFLQISIVFLLGVFFSKFFQQMKVETMSSNKAWFLFVITSFGIYFKNWIQYAGKKLTVKKAKKKGVASGKSSNIIIYWLLPFGCIALGILILQAVN